MGNKDKIMSLVKFFALLLILIITTYFLFVKLSVLQQATPVFVDTAPDPERLLSEAEIRVERDNLIKVTPSLEEVPEITSSSTSKATILTPEELANFTNETNSNQVTETLPSQAVLDTMTSSEVKLIDERAIPVAAEAPKAQVYLKPNSGISVISSGIVDEQTESAQPTTITTSGTIFSISKTSKSIAIIEGENQPFNVSINDVTKITINGSKIKFTDLKIGDIVEVAGKTLSETKDIDADSVKIVGAYQIIPMD